MAVAGEVKVEVEVVEVVVVEVVGEVVVVVVVVGEVVVEVVVVVVGVVVVEVVDFVVLVVEVEVVVVVGEVVVEVVVEVVPVPEYVLPLKASVYVLMSVAAWSPGLVISPTANPSSIEEPTPKFGKSYGEAPDSLKGR